MQHILPEICAASPAGRQHPGSRSSVPTTALAECHLLLITPMFLALLLAEQRVKTCPYPRPRKSQEFTVAFFAEEIRMFL